MANGLINLQTDLKSLRYGNDKPYITKNIGQAPGSQIGMEAQHRIDDTSRIAQMLIDKPGVKYLLNEALLQQIDIDKKIKNRGNKTVAGAVLGQLGNTLVGTAKILGSTLAQVPVNGTGLHFLKGFRTDTYLQPSNGNQASGFAQFFGAGGIEGAPLALQGKPIKGVIESNFSSGDLRDNGNDGTQLYTADKTYTGKDSIYNIGAALSGSNNIPTGDVTKYYSPDFNYPVEDNTLGKDKIPAPQNLSQVKEKVDSTSEEIISENSFSQKVEDFRQGSSVYYSFDYNNRNIKRETRVNLGDQGKKKAEGFYTQYSNIDPDAIDKLNALDISSRPIDGTEQARDLAKLYFEIITPDGSKFLHFRAFIDSIDDSYNADWQGSKYVGRAENFYTYGGFERDISISFKIAAATRSEMKPLYRKMVYLASSTAPTYGGEGFMRGSLAKITVGSYFSQIPGVITSVKFNLIDGMPWEIAMQNPEAGTDDDVQELPMGLQCNVSFKAIHDFAPQTGLQHYFTNPKPVNGAKPFF